VHQRRSLSASLIVLALVATACGSSTVTPSGPPETQPPSPTVTTSPAPAATVPSPTPAEPASDLAPVRVRVPLPRPEIQAPNQVAIAGGLIWFDPSGKTLDAFDPVTARFTTSTPLDYAVGLQVADDGSLWTIGPWGYAPGPDTYTVSLVDLETGRVRDVAETPPSSVAIGLGSIWAVARRNVRQLDITTGAVQARWDLNAAKVQIACGAVWILDSDGDLVRLDPASGLTSRFEGHGPVYDAGITGCWRWVDGGIERLWPLPVETTFTAETVSTVMFDGSIFWRRTYGTFQRWDPVTGSVTDQFWRIDAQDISPHWKVGDDGLVLTVVGSVWLVNGFEIVGYDIPVEPRLGQ